ncbi:MAG: TrbG/VirB9 family P-type conjugative transfer protein [Alphaproteobacteria bacterium]
MTKNHNLLHTTLFILTILLTNINQVFSAQLPRYLGSEKKFRSYVYNPNELYRYFGHYTYQGFIEFEAGEVINTISMGNPTLWLVETLDNRLFLKPVGEDNSETNMTVLTTKRVYHFELVAKEAKGMGDKDLIFVVKFLYPDEKDKNIVEFAKTVAPDEPDLRDLSSYNFNYQYTGEKIIAPSKVFDDGIFTYLEFSNKNSEAPAIYSVDSEGFETIVNYRIAGKYMVVEKVAPQFTLRNGSDIVCVYNMNTYTDGSIKNSTLLPNQKGLKLKQNFEEAVPNNFNPSPNYNQQALPSYPVPAIQNLPSYATPPQGMSNQVNNSLAGNDPAQMFAPPNISPNANQGFAGIEGMDNNSLMQPKSARSRALGLPF